MSSKIVAVKSVIVVVILVLVGVLGVLGVTTVKTYLSGATAGFEPSGVAAVPAADGATVSWTSSKEAMGFVEYGTTPASLLLRTQEESSPTTSHQVKVEALKGNTTYYYRIRSGDSSTDKNEWEIFDNNGIPYTFKTGGSGGDLPAAEPTSGSDIVGTIITPQPVVPVATSSATSACQLGVDYNGDGVANSMDYRSCLAGSAAPTATVSGELPNPATSSAKVCTPGVDYNGDGVVNSLDILKCRQGP